MTRRSDGWSRREFLAAAGAALGATASGDAAAFGPASQVGIAELDLGPGTVSRANAWRRLLHDVVQTTSVFCNTAEIPRVKPEDDRMFETPFLVLVGDGGFQLPGDRALEQLGRFLAYGGFLFIDDLGGPGGAFERSARALVQAVFPTRPLAPLAADHSVYRAFFLIDRPLGRTDRQPWMEGIAAGSVTPLMYFQNDLSGALDRDNAGRQQPVVGSLGGEAQRREAVKLGINLVMYSLTSNYKQDQAHVAELLRQRRLDGLWE